MSREFSIEGGVDLHTHCGPSPFDRRVDGYECAREVAEAGMDGVVLKEHHLPTAYGVPYVDRLLDRDGLDVEVVGSVVLNYCVGGFNPFVVQAAADYGAKVVWAPTIDARHHANQTGDLGAFLGVDAGAEYEGKDGVTAFVDDPPADGTPEDRLTRDVRLCLDKVADEDLVFAVGHLSFEETRAIVDYLADRGHGRVVVDHPNYSVTDLTLDQQRDLADRGAVLNYPYMAITEAYGWSTPEAVVESIRAVGVENAVVSSDVGQPENPSVPESLERYGDALVDAGLAPAEFEELVVDRPKEILDLD
ncbi:MAG: DUF6282 family protein [Haloarculaceae archaeon]